MEVYGSLRHENLMLRCYDKVFPFYQTDVVRTRTRETSLKFTCPTLVSLLCSQPARGSSRSPFVEVSKSRSNSENGTFRTGLGRYVSTGE